MGDRHLPAVEFGSCPKPHYYRGCPAGGGELRITNCFLEATPRVLPGTRWSLGGRYTRRESSTRSFQVQSDDLPAKLQAQLTAAYLNILSGADQSYIETTIFEAYAWLVQHPAGSQVTDSEQEEGTRLFNLAGGV